MVIFSLHWLPLWLIHKFILPFSIYNKSANPSPTTSPKITLCGSQPVGNKKPSPAIVLRLPQRPCPLLGQYQILPFSTCTISCKPSPFMSANFILGLAKLTLGKLSNRPLLVTLALLQPSAFKVPLAWLF